MNPTELPKINLAALEEINHQINLAGFVPRGYGASEESKSRSLTYIVSMSVVAGIIIPLTVIGNLVTIIAVVKEIKRGQTQNMYILSHAVADFFIGVAVEPLYLYQVLNIDWELGQVACYFYLISDFVVIFASQFTIFVVIVDRYLRVLSPIKYKTWITKRKVNFMILLTWVIPAVAYSLVYTLVKPEGYTRKENVCEIPIQTVMWVNFYILLFQFWVPTMFKIFFFWRIYAAAVKASKSKKRQKSRNFSNNHNIISNSDQFENNSANENNNQEYPMGNVVDPRREFTIISEQKQTDVKSDSGTDDHHTISIRANSSQDGKVMMTISLIVGLFIVLHSPFAVYLILPPICGAACRSPVIFELFFGLVYMTSALNPFLYALGNKPLKVSMINIMKCKC